MSDVADARPGRRLLERGALHPEHLLRSVIQAIDIANDDHHWAGQRFRQLIGTMATVVDPA
jgi:hypothetical protein